jgi:ABC-type dipeptide/oligopeptide/nickel transport system permease component
VGRYLAGRLLQAVVTIFVAVVVVFLLIRLLPNNPVLSRFGQHAVPEQVAIEMARQGWDQPLLAQLKNFIASALGDGDLGESFFLNETVVEGIERTFPATLELALSALMLAVPLGVVAGVAAAVWRNRLPDYLCMSGSLLGVSVPVFFLGICLMFMFPQMPTRGRLPLGADFDASSGFIVIESLFRGRFDIFNAALRHLCLPAIALSTIPMAVIARITRSSMLDVLSADYVRTARAKGASPPRVVARHALPNAGIPITNIAGLQIGVLLTGAVLTETVFDWPGMGTHLVDAVRLSDYNVVQGCTLMIVTLFVAISLVLDVIYLWLDPRIRFSGGADG